MQFKKWLLAEGPQHAHDVRVANKELQAAKNHPHIAPLLMNNAPAGVVADAMAELAMQDGANKLLHHLDRQGLDPHATKIKDIWNPVEGPPAWSDVKLTFPGEVRNQMPMNPHPFFNPRL